MFEQLPTPTIEVFIMSAILGSITLLFMGGLLAIGLFRVAKFRWASYLLILLLAFTIGQVLSSYIWSQWPFSFDIMFGPFFLPGIVGYGVFIITGYCAVCYLNKH